MKKILIGGFIGGILLFAWQTISWTVANLHEKGQEYTAKQDTVLSFLANVGLTEGSYLLPNSAPGTSMEEMQKEMNAHEGKPWASIRYYNEMKVDMSMNMIRGLLANIIIVSLLCWILIQISQGTFSTYLLSCIAIGILSFTNGAYTGHIWYPLHDINAHLIDALASWGLVGIWLGWWLPRK